MKNLIIFAFVLSSTSLFAQNQLKGFAVFYADYFQGRPTANGEIYDEMKYTAASRNFPFGSILKVTRLDEKSRQTNDFVLVRVNDRGPFAKQCPECILDLSWIAADKIGLTLHGKSEVLIEWIGNSKNPIAGSIKGYESKVTRRRQVEENNQVIQSYSYRSNQSQNSYVETPKQSTNSNFMQGGTQLRSKGIDSGNEVAEYEQKEEVVLFGYNSESSKFPSSSVSDQSVFRNISEGYGIQLASYVDKSNALRYFENLKNNGLDNLFIKTIQVDSKTYFKIIKGQYSSKEDAEVELYRLNRDTKYRGYVLLLSK